MDALGIVSHKSGSRIGKLVGFGRRQSFAGLTLASLLCSGCFAPDLGEFLNTQNTQTSSGSSSESGTATSSAATAAATSSGSTAGSTSTSSDAPTASTGTPGCVGDSDCDDNNACTRDRCEAEACVHAPETEDPACACEVPADCTQFGPDDECRTTTCENQVCGQSFTPEGTPLSEGAQQAEDCQRLVCDGFGGSRSEADDRDVPDDDLECTLDACEAGTPSHTPVDAGTVCSAGMCDETGQCTGCTSAADCGTSTFCQSYTCNAGICGVLPTAQGTALPEQTAGDCRRQVCDDRGNVTAVADDDDRPEDDGRACTADICANGQVLHPPRQAGSRCEQGGGRFCDGAGECVPCTDDTQCPGRGDCGVGLCQDHQCVVGLAEVGTPCNDGLFCTGRDRCDANGRCVGAGDPCDGPDGDRECAETCDEATDSCTAPDRDGTPCGPCRRCASGRCGGGCSPLAQCCGDRCQPAGNPCL